MADTPDRGRALVDSLADEGASFLKLLSGFEPEVFRAVGQRARERGLPFVGHVPFLVTAREASELGQRSIEHPFGIAKGCSSVENEVIREFADSVAAEMAQPDVDPGRLWYGD